MKRYILYLSLKYFALFMEFKQYDKKNHSRPITYMSGKQRLVGYLKYFIRSIRNFVNHLKHVNPFQ